MSEKCASILLVGIGGYGNGYVDDLILHKDDPRIKIVGAVDPFPQSCKNLQTLKDMNVPLFNTMEEFYKENKADLAVISTPIQFHREHVCLALANGTNVLCEKPVTATIQDAYKMIEARDKSGKFVAIGYQWSHSDQIQALKKDIMDGVYGKPIRLKTMVLWPRGLKYYNRGWAAHLKDSQGRWILDSVANNATAHFLHNMFYVLGDKVDASAKPARVTAELYRANNIENFDTAGIRVITENNVELLFLVTHSVLITKDPTFCFEFEKGKIILETGKNGSRKGAQMKGYLNNGTEKSYGRPDESKKKLWMAVDSVLNGTPVVCGIEAASSHLMCINASHMSMPKITNMPDELVKHYMIKDEMGEIESETVYVEGLSDVITECFENWKLPSETGASWAKKGKEINLEGFTYFDGSDVK